MNMTNTSPHPGAHLVGRDVTFPLRVSDQATTFNTDRHDEIQQGRVLLACPVADLDAQSGDRPGMGAPRVLRRGVTTGKGLGYKADVEGTDGLSGYSNSGGASRFFPVFRYEAKADTAERPRVDGVAHPTVKPLELMRWLVRLVTPSGGLVLDPFAGSGTTAEACVVEGFCCITVERDATYLPLIKARLSKPIQPAMDLFGEAS